MFITCEDYYTNYLGDSCNNDCNNCFGNKEVYIVNQDFEVCGSTVLDKVKINKGSWYWIGYKNETHVGLYNGTNKILHISLELFNKYFSLNE